VSNKNLYYLSTWKIVDLKVDTCLSACRILEYKSFQKIVLNLFIKILKISFKLNLEKS